MASLKSWLPWGSSNTSTPAPPPLDASPPATPPAPAAPASPAQNVAATQPPMSESKRILKQLALPAFGAAFLLLSVRMTRRSTARKLRETIPPYYHPNNAPPVNPPNGAMDALEALQLATLNVFSVAMLLIGGGAFAMDVSTIEDLRERFKATDMGEEWEKTNKAAEEEWEEWAVSILARKELKDKAKAMADAEAAKKN
ncbi:hypothetical protein BZA77DRAFT_306477 [Pyronema omphalodes]|nr:hypothetical protein BZA77DRAFT_306477 [Pyronema omphalodes]